MSSSAKKQKTVDLPKLPKISDSVEEPIVQTLATVCAKLYDEALNAAWKPTDGSEPDKFLAQPYELSKEGGQYKEGGEYTAAGSKYMYTEGEGALVSGYHVFNKDTTQVVEGWFEAPVTLRVKLVWLVPQLASQPGWLPTES